MADLMEDRAQFQVDRLAYFSDAVFAIAITLLALNIHAPTLQYGTEIALRTALFQMVPGIIGFVVSFFVISNYWRAHHRLFRWVGSYNDTMVTINLLLLLSVSFIPCPTAFYSDHPNFQTPLIFYCLSLALVGILQFVLWRYITRRPELLRVESTPFEVAIMSPRALLIPIICGLAIILSFISLGLAGLTLILIPVFLRLYTRIARRKIH